MADPNQHPDPARWWRHRRRLAYWAMSALTLMALAGATGQIRADAVPLLQTIAWVFGIVVVAYYGNNAAEALATKGPTR